jgi:hypothetical protein
VAVDISDCEGFGIYGPFGIPLWEGPKARACRKALSNDNKANRRAENTNQTQIRQENNTLRYTAQQEQQILSSYWRNADGSNPSEAIAGSIAGAVPSVASAVMGAVNPASMLFGGGLGGLGTTAAPGTIAGLDPTTALLGLGAVVAVALAVREK